MRAGEVLDGLVLVQLMVALRHEATGVRVRVRVRVRAGAGARAKVRLGL